MKLYEILVTETCIYKSIYTVLANSEEEAKRLYYNGESEFEDSEWIETLDDTIDKIECVNNEVPD